MLGQSGPDPITEGASPGRMLAFLTAALLIVGGGYYAWSEGKLPQLALPSSGQHAAPAASPSPPPIAVTPQLRSSYVVDGAKMLSDETEQGLNDQLRELNMTAGPQVVVMTVPDLGGDAIEAYSLRVANQWGIGDPDRKDGVLLLIAPNQHQVRIEVGRGLQSSLTNAESKRIVDETMLPQFRAGNFDAATQAGAKAIAEVLTAHPSVGGQ